MSEPSKDRFAVWLAAFAVALAFAIGISDIAHHRSHPTPPITVTWIVDDGVPEPQQPTVTATRAETVAMLWRYAGTPKPNQAATFLDVPETHWAAEAVAWAQHAGIVHGDNSGLFHPDQPTSRAQTIAMIERYDRFVTEK